MNFEYRMSCLHHNTCILFWDYFHDKCPTLRSKTKMTKKYFETKTLFKEVTNFPLEEVHLVGTVGEPLRG